MTVLRQFLYRDGDQIREFLSQVEGGLFDEESRTEHVGGNSALKGGAKAGPVALGGQRGSERSEQVERVVRQTEASEFDRLYAGLEAQGGFQYLDAIDEGIWDQLRRGELLEIEAIVQPAGFDRIVELMGMAQQFMPMMDALGADGVDPETRKLIESVSQLNEAGRPETFTVVASLAGAPAFKFACTLRGRYVLADLELLAGESTVLGKIQRKLRPGEQHLVASVFGGLEDIMSDEDQREMVEALLGPEVRQLGLASPLLEHPAAILTPIAIYR